jgi:hypothetical protein
MNLPTLTLPTFKVKLPSDGKTYKFRPFLVKEEKLLLIAAQSKEASEIISTTKQIISSCCLSPELNINDLPFFDMDYLFVILRSKSIGETIDINLTCNHLKEDGTKCGTVFPAVIDTSKIEVVKNKVENKILLTDTVGVQLKYPKYSAMKTYMSEMDPYTRKMKIIYGSVDYLFDSEKVYSSKDFTTEDFDAFFDQLTTQQVSKLDEWIENLPYFQISLDVHCPKCNYEHKLKYKDFSSFFF